MMKKLLLGLSSLFVFSLATAEVTQKSLKGVETIDFKIDAVDFLKVEAKNFVQASLRGVKGYEAVEYRESFPEIPVLRFYIESSEIQVKDLSLNTHKNTQLSQFPIFPVQASQVKKQGALPADFQINKSIYNQDSFYPQKLYSIAEAGSRKGVKRYLVTLYPFSVNSKTQEYRLRDHIRVQYKTSKSVEVNMIQEHFVAVVPSEFQESEAVTEYLDFKKSLGYVVSRLNLEATEKSPEFIRQKLKEIYETQGLDFVLLIGDSEYIPGYNSSLISGTTDHYYRAIDTDEYSADINGPDIGVGRIAAKTEEQLKVIFKKYMDYVIGVFETESWLEGASFLATNDRHTVAEGSHNYAIENYTTQEGYMGFVPEENTLGGDQVYAITHRSTGEDALEAFRAGRTIINYSGHGARTYWDSPRVSAQSVQDLEFNGSFPFVISNACITGDFRTDESFAESWQRSPGGGVMFWGSMDNTYWGEDDILEKRMYDAIYLNGANRFSEITQQSLTEHWLHYGGEGRSKYYWETYVVFGDPSLSFRSNKTKKITLIEERPFQAGEALGTLKFLDADSIALEGLRVALMKNEGELLGVSYSTAEGIAQFQLDEKETISVDDELQVVVLGENTQLLKQTLEISNK